MADETVRDKRFWTSWAMTALVVLFLLVDAVGKLFAPKTIVDATVALGFDGVADTRAIGLVLLICTVLHIVPRTTLLGALLLTAYLGGAVAIQLRVDAPVLSTLLFGVYLGVIMWGGLWLRDERVRALIPLTQR
ncbi:hypothetical protein GOARA_059_00110 [Gordonia araii NBRC 100433]|uniref:DoxX family protein n=1 Tax=Gordonia araii NBRC 100433 TaxID=1073574 RepID=G7H3X0_9ACTN|nr:DoxX family protein [Gordonia araii]GAB10545.1 hypothetical protein GOARA_059_00110 [Gordonia araii NBRC 100433]